MKYRQNIRHRVYFACMFSAACILGSTGLATLLPLGYWPSLFASVILGVFSLLLLAYCYKAKWGRGCRSIEFNENGVKQTDEIDGLSFSLSYNEIVQVEISQWSDGGPELVLHGSHQKYRIIDIPDTFRDRLLHQFGCKGIYIKQNQA